jgi:hypothetical protein
MPRKPLKPKRRKQRDELFQNQRVHLISGYTYVFLDGPNFGEAHNLRFGSRHPFPFTDDEHRKRLWFEYRDELIRAAKEKGKVPRAYFDYEAHEGP